MKAAIAKLLVLFTLVAGATAVMPVQPASAACQNSFLTFPAWHKGLTKGDCSIKSPDEVGGLSNFIWAIVLNVLNILIQAVAYVSGGFIIWGGFQYLIAAGSSDRVTSARKTIQNAVIGLVISLFAVIVISYVAGQLA
ncbi:MAG TPA: hypothetical protein VGE34_04135 [Candidatus Saccharimonadales bacterium]